MTCWNTDHRIGTDHVNALTVPNRCSAHRDISQAGPEAGAPEHFLLETFWRLECLKFTLSV